MIRPYEERDRAACRALWGELTIHHRELYEDDSIGGADPGAHFDTYVADPKLDRVVVAERGGEVVGLSGLLVDGKEAEVEPVVVSRAHRGRGIGRALLAAMVGAAREKGVRFVSTRPVARNAGAIRMFHRGGFRMLGRVELMLPLRDDAWENRETLHGLEFTL